MTRRGWLALAAGLMAWPRDGFAAKEFWEAKDPDSWSPDEIKKLLTKSPWAHEISGERTAAKRKEPAFPKQPPVNNKGHSSRVSVPNDTSPAPSTRVLASYKGIVVWESAKPVRLATREPLGKEFEDMYVVSLAGVPVGAGKGALEKVRAVSTLHAKGRGPLEAALVRPARAHEVFLFGFSRQALEISREEKEVLFGTTVNRVPLSAKFNPRDMVYRGELAL
jgi:hypothetical protein